MNVETINFQDRNCRKNLSGSYCEYLIHGVYILKGVFYCSTLMTPRKSVSGMYNLSI